MRPWLHADIAVGEEGCILGLNADGTVLVDGDNSYMKSQVSEWKNIVGLAGGTFHMVGLCADGSVVAAGENSNGKCSVTDWMLRR